MDGKLFLAPIGDYPQKIVDLGTGVGLWAQDSLFLRTSTLRYRRLTLFYPSGRELPQCTCHWDRPVTYSTALDSSQRGV